MPIIPKAGSKNAAYVYGSNCEYVERAVRAAGATRLTTIRTSVRRTSTATTPTTAAIAISPAIVSSAIAPSALTTARSTATQAPASAPAAETTTRRECLARMQIPQPEVTVESAIHREVPEPALDAT